MRLADLRVFTDEEFANPSPIEAYGDLVKLTRPVTVADLIVVLKEERAIDYEAATKRLGELNPSVRTRRGIVKAVVNAALDIDDEATA